MKHKITQFIPLLSLVSLLGMLNCRNVWDVEGELQQDAQESALKEILNKFDTYNNKVQESDLQLNLWIERTKRLLSLDEKVPEPPSKFEEVSGQISKQGHRVSTALDIIGGGAKLLGYFVPGVGVVGDVLAYNKTILDTGLKVADQLRPSEIKEKLNTTQEYLLSLKHKTLGLNEEEKSEALAKLKTFNNTLSEAKNLSIKIEELYQELSFIYQQSLAVTEFNNTIIKAYTKEIFQQQTSSLLIISELSSSVILTGDIIADSINRYKSENTIAQAIEEWRTYKDLPDAISASIKEHEKNNAELLGQ